MNRTTFSLVRVITCGLFLMFAVGVAKAQFKAGIQGTVTDTAGGLVQDAKITLTNTETGKTQETERDEQWVVTIPERLSETAYETLAAFVRLAAECMGVEGPEG